MSVREWLVRIASRAVPESYRDEVVADLRDQHTRAASVACALCRSGRDARRHLRGSSEAGSFRPGAVHRIARAGQASGRIFRGPSGCTGLVRWPRSRSRSSWRWRSA